jgi:hypothetical protein
MDVAALVISVLALMTAVASVLYVRRQTATGEHLRGIEDRRDRDERRPTFEVSVDRNRHSRTTHLTVRLRQSHRPLVSVTVEIIDSDGVTFTDSQHGVTAAGPGPIKRASAGPLEVGEAAVWRLALEERSYARETRLVLRCSDGTDEWLLDAVAKNPNPPGRVIVR